MMSQLNFNLYETKESPYLFQKHFIFLYVCFGQQQWNGSERPFGKMSNPRVVPHKSDVALLVYDVTKEESFQNLVTHHLPDIASKQGPPHMMKILVGNKTDLASGGRAVTKEQAQEFAAQNSLGTPYWEISAVTGVGLETMLRDITLQVLEKQRNNDTQVDVFENKEDEGRCQVL
eukprot:TRINITY_DN3212_c0_g1_i1.p1 TRINITY_DN3212_c0_g1~~TRINITY_DN3212_c0_g1_i1.p1  ORF type:complete len:175 (-),score=43.47 TRINITY_DN3212_c0_g1_i1:170-694(-)